jgi:hypothetical protein
MRLTRQGVPREVTDIFDELTAEGGALDLAEAVLPLIG